MSLHTSLVIALIAGFLSQPAKTPLLRTVDLNVGEKQAVELSDGRQVILNLTDIEERTDDVRSAVRLARARIEVNGAAAVLECSMYRLPVEVAGVRIDCPVSKSLVRNSRADFWAMEKDARFRLWPAGSPLIAPGTFVYPVKQRWFASDTQMAHEPVFVDRGECPSSRPIYYHAGLDFAGAEGLVDVVAATDGLVVSVGEDVLAGHEQGPVSPRYDVVYLHDSRGWYYRYSHMQRIEPQLKPGHRIRMGDKIGVLGKEGGSGGFSHLHFEIFSLQPSGRWGSQEAYGFVWEAYLREHRPALLAVARPHQVAWAGQSVRLDGTRSWSESGRIARYDWTFTNGDTMTGAIVEKTYPVPGAYSEILKITDAAGRVAYDFAVVQVIDPARAEQCIPTIHAACSPTWGIAAGEPVTFKVRTFGTTAGEETWDFGDGSPPVRVRSDGNVDIHASDGYAATVHVYSTPGEYLARVERTDEHGVKAVARLHVPVGSDKPNLQR